MIRMSNVECRISETRWMKGWMWKLRRTVHQLSLVLAGNAGGHIDPRDTAETRNPELTESRCVL